MMRYILLVILVMFSEATLAQQASVITIDQEHLQIDRSAGNSPPPYVIHAADSLQLDSSAYKFEIPPELKGAQPNSIQVILGKDEQYSSTWQPSQRLHMLTKDTLTPNPGSPPFRGFMRGQKGVIAIGRLDGSDFSVVWVAMFVVK